MSRPLALVVDDNVNNIRLIETYLSLFGYDFFSTTNPLEVQDIIDYKRPSIIFLDLNMPQEHGTVTLEKLKSVDKHKSIPVIVLTAENSEDVLSKCFNLGASDYITKPISEIELKARMDSVLKIQKLTDEVVALERKATAHAMVVTANHHINQPLTVLKGHVELLQVFGKDQFTEKSNKNFEAIHSSIKRIQEIITQMENIENIEFTSYADGINMIDIEKK
jgi:CheY-like chemotaxis protein